MILRRGERQSGHAIAERKERRLLAGEEFLDHDLAGSLAQAAAEHHVDGRVRGSEVFRDDHALAGGKPVGLDHDRRAALADIGLCRFGCAETFVGGGGYAVRAAQILGESLGALKPGGGSARPERLDAGGLEIVDDPGAQRRLRPDDDEIDIVLAAKPDHARMVGEVERDAFGLARDAGIARRANEPVAERACRQLPGQRMFAPAGAEEQNVHRLECLAAVPVACGSPGARRRRVLSKALDPRRRCGPLAAIRPAALWLQ